MSISKPIQRKTVRCPFFLSLTAGSDRTIVSVTLASPACVTGGNSAQMREGTHPSQEIEAGPMAPRRVTGTASQLCLGERT